MRAVGYRASPFVADTGRMPTKSIWDNIPWTSIQDKEREGWVFWDDFINIPTLDEADAKDTIYASFGDAGADIRQGVANEFGEIIISTDGGDNEEAWISTGGDKGGLAKFILQATAVPHTIAFEVRWKKSSITIGQTFVGFGEEGLVAADGFFSDTGVIADKDYLGFVTPEVDPNGVDWAYNKASGTDQIVIADVDTVVADTYMKSGFIYNYLNPAAQQIKCYIDGVRQSTFITKANIDNATNFPGGEEMVLLAGCKETSAASQNLTIDWWRAALVVNS